MFGIEYNRSNPTDYILHFSGGKPVHEGAGLAFFYFAPSSTIASVPLVSSNIPFAFQAPTSDFQIVAIQGQMTYRIAEPKKAAATLDFTVDRKGKYINDHYQKLPERLIYSLQTLLRTRVQAMTLREALAAGDGITDGALNELRESAEVKQLGIDVLNLSILSLRPTPDVAKALEAEAREALNRESDLAIYERRNAAIEQERRIKENKLQTELLVQSKQRELQEREIEGAIALEAQRKALLEEKTANERKEADSRAYALNAVLAPIQGMDWRVLTTLQGNKANPGTTIAMAFQELAANAQKIGELNMSPDLLRTLLEAPKKGN